MIKAIKVIKIVNNSHNTEINLRPRDNRLSLRQIKRAKKKLCGTNDCPFCNKIGVEGIQDGFRIELVTKRTGEIMFGLVHPAPKIEKKKIDLCFRNPYSGEMTYFDK